ncbi:MAG: hypothetical protein WAU88_06500 [Candidatus Zixiibacteriota bacterium]
MKSTLTLIAILLLCLSFACSDNPSGPSGQVVHLSATIIACNCYWWGPWHGPYTAYTGKKAVVTLTRDDGLSYTKTADDSSRVRCSLDTGTYRVYVETFHSPKFSFTTVRVTADTSGLSFGTELHYNPPDSLNVAMMYPAGTRVWTEQEERQGLERLNSDLDGLFDFSKIRRVTSAYFDTTYVRYEQVGVKHDMAGWKAERKAQEVIDRHPERYPTNVSFYGYFHICLTN